MIDQITSWFCHWVESVF